MQLTLITLIGLCVLQINAAPLLKRASDDSSKPAIDYHANKDYVPFQRLDNEVEAPTGSFLEEEEESHETSETHKKYGVTTVGSRQYRYRDSTGEADGALMVPQKAAVESTDKSSLPRRKKQTNLIGLDDKGHVRRVMLDSKKDDNVDPRVGQKQVLAIDDQGGQHTIALPMTLVPGGR
ncbi:hypothetical protein [Absidia glauca]|uniref:Secreted protein n=1 Tax=Absidia glauca TaxID=4829 RepID=A0A168Q781_ABSGL|nr:hypothetical protein [Absidia glauca]